MKSKFSLKLTDAFRDRKFKYSGTATLLVVCVVVATLLINLFCSLIPWKLDTTANKLYSISNKTLSVLNRLEDNINIHFVYQAGTEDVYVMELISRYASASDNISTNMIDPVANPKFTEMFASDKNKSSTVPTSGSVIVESEGTGLFVVLTSQDFYSYEYEENSLAIKQTYYTGEQAVTGAIAAVTTEETYKIALLTGHNEDPIPAAMSDQLNKMFFEVYKVDLKVEDIQSGTDVLIVLQPEWDIDDVEYAKIATFLETDTAGSVMFIMGKATADMKNFDKIFSNYQLELTNDVIYEEDSSKCVGGMKYNLYLDYLASDVTSKTSGNQKLFLPNAKRIIANPDLAKVTTYYTDIAVSSNKAWASSQPKSGTMDYDAATDFTSKNGFVPMMAIEDYDDSLGSSSSKLFVVNCANFMLSNEASLNSYANDEVFYSALSWCLDDDATQITITPKYYLTSTHGLSTGGVYAFGIVLGLVLPLAILGGGLAVYLKRRHL